MPLLAAGTDIGSVHFFGNQEPSPLSFAENMGVDRVGVEKLEFSKDGVRLYAALGRQMYSVLTYPTKVDLEKKWYDKKYTPHPDAITNFSLHPVRQELYSTSVDGTICLYDLRNSSPYHIFHNHRPLYSIALLPEHERIIVGDAQGHVKLWSLRAGRLEYDFALRHIITSINVAPDETMFTVGSDEGTLDFFTLVNNRYVHATGLTKEFGFEVVQCGFVQTALPPRESWNIIVATSKRLHVGKTSDGTNLFWEVADKGDSLVCCRVSKNGKRAYCGN